MKRLLWCTEKKKAVSESVIKNLHILAEVIVKFKWIEIS